MEGASEGDGARDVATPRVTDSDVGLRLRALPPVDQMVTAAGDLVAVHGRGRVVGALRRELDERRSALMSGAAVATDVPTILRSVASALDASRAQGPQRVINATGVVVHTNLGRAPLSGSALDAVMAASGYCDLEYDLVTGERGSRGAALDSLLADVTGAEAGLVVNNAAAALVLTVATLAAGRDVVVSRGELIEIGGSFRLPDILASAGARLVEVGTTNRTRATDYSGGNDVGLLLKMHPSNYRIVGFTEAPSVAALAEVARGRSVPLVYDVGSGLLAERSEAWTSDEPTLRGAIAEGADVVIASGDKLLGGPQAGLIVGRKDLIARCRRHPLARALRVDKLRVAALVATLDAHRRGTADTDVPVWRMLSATPDLLEHRSQALVQRVAGAAIVAGGSVPGGGSAPGTLVEGPAVIVAVDDPEISARRLRLGNPPVIVRVEHQRLVVDLRTVDPEDDDVVTEALTRC